MRNVSDMIFRENHITYFLLNKVVSNRVPFMRKCGKSL